MKILSTLIITLLLLPVVTQAANRTTASIIAEEPVTMMDLGLLKLNSVLNSNSYPGLRGATIGANYNHRSGTIDIKVSLPVIRASRKQCIKAITATKNIFLKKSGKNQVSTIHHYFQHEGTSYRNKINWNDLGNHVVVTGIVLTKINYQHSVYCQSNLMKDKVTF